MTLEVNECYMASINSREMYTELWELIGEKGQNDFPEEQMISEGS